MRDSRALLGVLAQLAFACASSSEPPLHVAADAASSAADAVVVEVFQDASAEVTPDLGSPSKFTDLGPQPTTDGEWTWQLHHDGAPKGHVTYTGGADHEFELTRLEVWDTFEVRALRVQVDVPKAATLAISVFDDLGGDFLAFEWTQPLVTVKRAVTPTDSRTWLTLALEPPLKVSPGRLVYVGLEVTGDAPQLVFDVAPSDPGPNKPGRSFVWRSKKVDTQTGGHSVFALAPGDFLVEAELRTLGVVAAKDTLFEKRSHEQTGLPELSRVALDDLDGDGDIDAMLDGPRVFLNDGKGHFTDVTATHVPPGLGSNGGVLGDMDDDGDPDYFGTGLVDVLLENDGKGHFKDVTATSGIDDTQQHTCEGKSGAQHVPTEASAWLDVDNDGLLDLYQGNFICWTEGIPSRDKLWHNEGGGKFTDWSASHGLDKAQGKGWASRGVAPADYDGDGDVDVLVTNYRLHPSLHLQNDGKGGLTSVGKATTLEGIGTFNGGGAAYGHAIGAAWGDIDHDGWLDVFIARLAHPRFLDFSQKAALYYGPGPNGGPFIDTTVSAGIRYQETASSPTLFDLDNDGDLDLAFTCVYEHRRTQVYRNAWPSGVWDDITSASGLTVESGWGNAVADLDGDLDLDFVARETYFNTNRLGGQGLAIRPVGGGQGKTNRSAVGARVRVKVGGVWRMQERVGAHGTGCQSAPWLHFGLGSASSADVEVVFPVTQTTRTFSGLAAGKYTVREDGSIETN